MLLRQARRRVETQSSVAVFAAAVAVVAAIAISKNARRYILAGQRGKRSRAAAAADAAVATQQEGALCSMQLVYPMWMHGIWGAGGDAHGQPGEGSAVQIRHAADVHVGDQPEPSASAMVSR